MKIKEKGLLACITTGYEYRICRLCNKTGLPKQQRKQQQVLATGLLKESAELVFEANAAPVT